MASCPGGRLREEQREQRERVQSMDAALRRQYEENEGLQRDMRRLSDELVAASAQLGTYERRLLLLEETSLRDRERASEMQQARKQILRDRLLIENALVQELGRVVPAGDRGGLRGCQGEGSSSHGPGPEPLCMGHGARGGDCLSDSYGGVTTHLRHTGWSDPGSPEYPRQSLHAKMAPEPPPPSGLSASAVVPSIPPARGADLQGLQPLSDRGIKEIGGNALTTKAP
jgi:hypothetical protein